MGEVSNNQSFHASSKASLVSNLVDRFKQQMDTVLQGGRDITIHLPPSKERCSANCRYNSTYKQFMGTNNALCKTCNGQGYVFERRYTIYRANIRTTDKMLDENDHTGQDTIAGRIPNELVRTKTVIDSYDHIKQSIGVEIDGVQYKLEGDPRKTGFGGQLMYVVAFWKESGK